MWVCSSRASSKVQSQSRRWCTAYRKFFIHTLKNRRSFSPVGHIAIKRVVSKVHGERDHLLECRPPALDPLAQHPVRLRISPLVPSLFPIDDRGRLFPTRLLRVLVRALVRAAGLLMSVLPRGLLTLGRLSKTRGWTGGEYKVATRKSRKDVYNIARSYRPINITVHPQSALVFGRWREMSHRPIRRTGILNTATSPSSVSPLCRRSIEL